MRQQLVFIALLVFMIVAEAAISYRSRYEHPIQRFEETQEVNEFYPIHSRQKRGWLKKLRHKTHRIRHKIKKHWPKKAIPLIKLDSMKIANNRNEHMEKSQWTRGEIWSNHSEFDNQL
ncbi:hypothetical protein AB6A40_005317 [Gnathostoma spinigerum]|uniref:Uncharacterized protein n=1 Tax=Gnathostoma spinigerum TaxID=75299 RepID=A0ABD6EF38_9BILA